MAKALVPFEELLLRCTEVVIVLQNFRYEAGVGIHSCGGRLVCVSIRGGQEGVRVDGDLDAPSFRVVGPRKSPCFLLGTL